jgi:hypothetical protein
MKRIFDAVIHGIDGQPMRVSPQDDTKLTLRVLATNALLSDFESERGLPGEAKFKRWELAKRIQAHGPVEIKPEEVADIKRLMALGYGPLLVGPAYEVLDADPETTNDLPSNVTPLGAA